jgi:ABC-type enterochelin transport system permease subunit
MLGNYRVAAQLVASRVVLSSTELVIIIIIIIIIGELFSSIDLILPVALGPGVYSASNRNEYQRHKSNVSGE